jgi:hypothetical protein
MEVVISKGAVLDDMIIHASGLDWDDADNFSDEEYREKIVNFPRNDERLVDCVRRLIRKEGKYCRFKIVDIPDDIDFVIEDYDGIEWVSEKHRTWR